MDIITGQELHEKSRQILIALNELYHSLPDKERLDPTDLKAIDLNADQIQCLAEDIRYYIRAGIVKNGFVEPK